MQKRDYYQKILETAETFIQTRGYDGFSYRDIAKLVGIKTSSIHYYFPVKADLGKAVVKKHIEALYVELDKLKSDARMPCRKKLEIFLDMIFNRTYFSEHKMCLGGMLAIDVLTLSEIIQVEVRIFFNRIEGWLKEVFTQAVKIKELNLEKKQIKNKAALSIIILEGALLMARLYQDPARLSLARKHIMEKLLKE